MMNLERACVFTGRCLIDLCLKHNDFVWLYCTLFQRHRNVKEFVCLDSRCCVTFSPCLDEGKEQRLVAESCVFSRNAIEFVCLYAASRSRRVWMRVRNRASCVFSRNAMLSSPPSFLIWVLLQVCVLSFMYITGACALWSERQYCD